MNILSTDESGAVIELTTEELGVLKLVGVEFTQGQFSPAGDDWDDLIPRPREQVADLFSQLP
jgi:hypothetical protein